VSLQLNSLACCTTESSRSSWEYFTTLDYEWRVIRRHLPYRWTIWVRNDRRFTPVQSAAPRRCADAHSVDLLPLAFHRSSEHYSFLCHLGRHDRDKLSSGHFDLYLPLPRALTSHNFEALDAFFNRGHILYSFPSWRRECSSPAVTFLVVLMPVLDCRFSIDRYSHVRIQYSPG